MELDRLVDRVALVGARAREHQVPDRALANLLAIGRVRPRRPLGVLFDRQAVVLADQPRHLGLRIVRDSFQPSPDGRVRPRPMRRRHRPVGRVAEEGVLEAQLDFAGQARRRAGEDQAAVGEASQRVADVRRAQGQSDRALPEDASHDRRLLQDATLGERQGFDPRDEHGLDRVRDRGAARFGEVADRLLEEVRVALGPCDHRRAQLIRKGARREQGIDEAGGIAGAERRDLDRFEAALRHEAWLAPQERRAGGCDEEERAVELRRDRGQRRDQRRTCPVEVLDDEDRPAALGVGPEEVAPRHWLIACGTNRGSPRSNGLPGMTIPADVARAFSVSSDFGLRESERREDAGEAVAEPLFRVLGAVVEPDAAGASQHLAERPVARAAAGREAAALEDRRGRRAGPRRREEFADETALADPRLAVHQDVARLPFAKGIVEGAEQDLELGGAPDERRLERGTAHGRPAPQRP